LERLTVLNRVMAKPLSTISLFQICLILIYVVSYPFGNLFPVSILRIVTGFLSILLFPGIIVANIILDEEHGSLPVSLIIGIILQILLIQALYLCTIIFGIQIPLFLWSSANTMVIFSFCIIWTWHIDPHTTLHSATQLDVNRPVLMIVGLGFVLRIILWFIAEGSIAPDAALYADFARSIMEGNFTSSVIGDISVNPISDSVAYLSHHVFTYIFAISWLLAIPTTSGPTLLLVIIGTVLIFPTFTLAKHFFGEQAAIWISLIVAIHPLFVFHSVVAYGPEIASLLLVMIVGLLLLNGSKTSQKSLILAGFLIGLIDAIWYSNFYLICVIGLLIPIIAIARGSNNQYLFLGFLVVSLIAKIFYLYLLLFLSLWIGLLVSIVLLHKLKPNLMLAKSIPFYLTILLSTLIWRLPNQIRALMTSSEKPGIGANPSLYFLDIPGLVDTTIRFLVFFAFYLTPGLIVILLVGLYRGRFRKEAMTFIAIVIVASFGTILMFSRIPGSLIPQYILSDSRFFLFITIMTIIASGAFFSSENYLSAKVSNGTLSGTRWIKHNWKSIRLLIILGIFMIPGYLAMPWGMASVDIEERYAWNGLPSLTESIGNSDTIFLADRAREFSWFTGRKSTALKLTQSNLGDVNASVQLISLLNEYNTSYMLIDDYAIAHWGVFWYLLRQPIAIGHSTILDHTAAIAQRFKNVTSSVYSCILIGQTKPNGNGVVSRVFQRSNGSFARIENIQLTDAGWSASNDGLISNSSGEIRLTIGPGASYTNTWRSSGADLNLEVNGGYLLFDVEEAGATITRIEILDDSGFHFANVEKITDSLYYCPLGENEIGDIRIVIEGNPGDSVIIKSISAWEIA